MKKLIVGNWKMNPENLAKAQNLFNVILSRVKREKKIFQNSEIIICPPFIFLPILLDRNKNSLLKMGAQNCFWEEKGAFTGEISPKALESLGVKYVILGHSERRRILGETDEMINKKLKGVLKAKLQPILCIGETEKEKKSGKTSFILKNQLKKGLNEILKKSQLLKIIIAYEPVWAIGTGTPCSPKDAKKNLIFLKKYFPQNKILYGGSVNSENSNNYLKVGFDGLLVGGASLNDDEFWNIVKKAQMC